MSRTSPLSLVAFLFFAAASASASSFGVLMTGGQEVPGPGDGDGIGFADFILDGTTLEYEVAVFNMDPPTAMHIHIGERGEAGNVFIGFPAPFTGNVNIGVMEIPASAAAALEADPSSFYLNVHNSAFPDGAIRGQVQYAYYLPVVGRTPGAVGTNFITRFSFVNLSTSDSSSGLLEFFPQSLTGTATRGIGQVPPISPLGQLTTDEILPEDLNGIGAIKFFFDERTDLNARILNDQTGNDAGTTGFAVDAYALEDISVRGTLPGLSTTTDAEIAAGVGYRTNLGYFNPHLYEVAVNFIAYSDEGTELGEVTITIPPGSMRQSPIFDIINSVPANSRKHESFWVSWVSSAELFVYASVVDNKTGDSVYID